ncbi:Serine--tRNA synthetase-like protein Slimp [Amphibalanus amphitrite]|uniref:Serine--tRNA synthetase-like protein Slimp n=1 Tax=Amphibalanus amphitrite TaxID=1232801 RepID=A0A6A4VDK0_AMPAM|nr:serine--tRNA synthetase-like protein Slimp [Amphibalanus amphitrite]XP_043206098.1 serine--tRNA synthetase-like protein Slimp [Amphibalanus amphitrite]XP_043206099.1 serine--tRNA synthetase-like protein Slimp [Amphibalanus amphitrite]KAF0292566.1 Serine--tRNA synthetase-like protein Slimp [Amphibalanus amphitrite]
MRLLRCLLSGAPAAALPSALYVSGRSAEHVVSVLRPCLDEALAPAALPALRHSVRCRRAALDLDALLAGHAQLQRLAEQKAELTRRRAEVAARGAQLRRSQSADAAQTEQLRRDGAALKERLRALQEPLWRLEEEVLPRLARLPNTLHPLTPEAEDGLEPVPPPERGAGPQERVPLPPTDPLFADVEPSDVSPGAYYLHGAAAELELALLEFACAELAAAGFARVSCPDTVKSLVAEGCGLEFGDPGEVARLAAWHEGTPDSPLGLHLVGGASLPAVCALLAKSRQPTAALPLRLAAAGRLYRPPAAAPAAAPQASAVRHLTACAAEHGDDVFEASLRSVTALVARLGAPCRLRHVAAPGLARSERRRTELQLLVARTGRHVTVAHVSDHGDWISRRLHAAHGAPGAPESRLLHLVEGAALLVPPALEALLETEPGRRRHWPPALLPHRASL